MTERADVAHRIALDRVEAEAWRDMAHAAPAQLADDLGIAVRDLSGISVLITRALDVLDCNRALGLGLLTSATDADVDAIVATFRDAEVPRFFVHVHPDARPLDLATRLTNRGIRPYDNWVRLHRSTDPPTPARTDLQIEQVGRDSAAIFADVVASGFGWDPRLGALAAAPVERPGWHHYLAYDGSIAVAAAALFVAGEYGWGGVAATLPAARGRGAQSGLLARRIAEARAAGCRWLSIETSEERPGHPSPSYRNVIRAGFSVAYIRPNHIGTTAELR